MPAVCTLSGMICYSVYLSNQAAAAVSAANYTRVEAGMAFILGWVGTGFTILATIIAFVSHVIR